MIDKVITAFFCSLIAGIVIFFKTLYRTRKDKAYNEAISQYQDEDTDNICDDIRGACLFYASEKGDQNLRAYLLDLVKKGDITREQAGKLFYEYAKNQDSRF